MRFCPFRILINVCLFYHDWFETRQRKLGLVDASTSVFREQPFFSH